jgi:hypothetical protein
MKGTSSEVRILKGRTPYSDQGKDPFTGQAVTGCGAQEDQDTWRCKEYGAATWMLSLCVRVYNAKVQAGRLVENLVSKSDIPFDWGDGQCVPYTVLPSRSPRHPLYQRR